tara:strand:- start:350 stop:808 length:459 start_codon:yes stop_codon:yes gene_type:complete
MLNLIKEGTTNTIAINPISSSFYFSLNSGSFNLNVTQDYDLSSGSLPLTKLAPIPAGYYNNYLLFSVPSATIPSYSGFYTAELEEYIEGPAAVWGTATFRFGEANFKWDADKTRQGVRTINTDRLKVVGTDQPSYISYTEANQDGQYTTYNR